MVVPDPEGWADRFHEQFGGVGRQLTRELRAFATGSADGDVPHLFVACSQEWACSEPFLVALGADLNLRAALETLGVEVSEKLLATLSSVFLPAAVRAMWACVAPDDRPE